jgi:hypothetical protein
VNPPVFVDPIRLMSVNELEEIIISWPVEEQAPAIAARERLVTKPRAWERHYARARGAL